MDAGRRKDKRRVRRLSALLVVAVTITASLIAFLGVAGGSSGQRSTDPGPGITQVPTHRRTRVSRIPAYTVYYLGATFEGLPVTDVTHTADAPHPETPELGRSDDVVYVYGDCPTYPPDSPASKVEGGCVTPIQVQATPLCEAHAALYSRPGGDTLDGAVPYPHAALRIKGVPAASFEGGTILELYTGDTTISIKGADGSQVRRAADGLRLAPGRAIPRVGKTLSHVSNVGVPPIVRRFEGPDAKVLHSTRECS